MTACTTRRTFIGLAGTAIPLMGRRLAAEVGSAPGPAYSAREIAVRLGIATAVYQKEVLAARHIAAIRAAGITRIELTMLPTFGLHSRARTVEVLQECRRQKMAVVSVHADLRRRYNDPQEERRRAALAQLLDETRFAAEAGAGILVAHLGTDDQSRKTVTELLDRTADLPICLTVENMKGGLRPYADFVDSIGSSRFGMTVDIGHIRDPDGVNPLVKKGRAAGVFAEGGRRIRHLHLHETFRLPTKADHHAPMHPEGIIEWGEVFAAIKAVEYSGTFLFEDGRGEDPDEWIRLAAAFPENFVARYR